MNAACHWTVAVLPWGAFPVYYPKPALVTGLTVRSVISITVCFILTVFTTKKSSILYFWTTLHCESFSRGAYWTSCASFTMVVWVQYSELPGLGTSSFCWFYCKWDEQRWSHQTKSYDTEHLKNNNLEKNDKVKKTERKKAVVFSMNVRRENDYDYLRIFLLSFHSCYYYCGRVIFEFVFRS